MQGLLWVAKCSKPFFVLTHIGSEGTHPSSLPTLLLNENTQNGGQRPFLCSLEIEDWFSLA